METLRDAKDGSLANMDQLFKINEMQSLLKVSRAQLYRLMNAKIIPFVYLGKERRFIGSQVMKAIKTMQTNQLQNSLRGVSESVPKDTLSDASAKLDNLNTQSNKDLRKALKIPDKIRNSKTVKRNRA